MTDPAPVPPPLPPDAAADSRPDSLAPPPPQTVHVVHDLPPAALFKVIGAVLGVWLVFHVWPVIVLVLLSLMLVATFNPLVRRLQARFNRTWAITAVTVGIVVLVAVLLVLIIPPF